MAAGSTQIWVLSVVLVLGICARLSFGHEEGHVHHQCNHGHHHHHHGGDHHHHHEEAVVKSNKLPEELAEEEDLKLYGLGHAHDHDHDHEHEYESNHGELSGIGLWVNAMGCSLLVSLASLICLIILPLIFIQGKPSKAIVDSLAVFGAGAMLGDAFLHQLPHAFGGEHSHAHDHDMDHVHSHGESGHSHSHSLKDLSVGLSVLAGIVVFLLVEKIVRYVEDHSGGANKWNHGHHHHHHHNKTSKKMKDDSDDDQIQQEPLVETNGDLSEEKSLDKVSEDSVIDEKSQPESLLRKRKSGNGTVDDRSTVDARNSSEGLTTKSLEEEPSASPSNLVFGYLNLFSDGVHNFTDGMALGSAFLLHGSVGGWSRTLFLLAHELPQEIGDFGILVRSGFTVSKALFFNFLSALVALVGTALALVMGQDPGHSSLIEGFTAGGFVYIAVAGVLAEMNTGSSAVKTSALQLTSLIMGMGVALCISLVE